MTQEPLTRDQFRNGVFARDGHKCVLCQAPGQDAHHIMERRLFPDGGYYLDNGATVCGDCHIKAEQTLVSTQELRDAAGIKDVVLPPHLYPDQEYDKWGNPIIKDGMRIKGELFDDPSIQKVLSPVLHAFTNRVKYPRTWHLPWSPGATKDDRMLTQDVIDGWKHEVVITMKMDGENTNFYNDGMHARSIDYEAHPSRDKMKALHASIAYNIPEGWRICCENLTAKHSLKYTNLKSICYVFSIWNGLKCMSWDDTILYTEVLGLINVPVLYRGPWDEAICHKITSELDTEHNEGIVVRPTTEFMMKEFHYKVGKFVRKSHVQTHGHWMRSKMEFNELAQ